MKITIDLWILLGGVSVVLTLIFVTFFIIKAKKSKLSIAAGVIAETFEVSFVLVDDCDRIIDFNRPFITSILGGLQIAKGAKIEEIVSAAEDKFKNNKDSIKIIHDIVRILKTKEDDRLIIKELNRKSYDVNISCFIEKGSRIRMRIITFDDITVYDNITRKLMDRKKELVDMNEEVMSVYEQLSRHASALEELAASREKSRLAKDVHDELGYLMIMLSSLMEESKRIISEKPDVAERKLHDAMDIARKGLEEIRCSVTGLAPEKPESENLKKALDELVEEYRNSGMKIDFIFEGQEDFKNPLYSKVLYKTCQEALTNSLKHGRAKNVVIILKLINKCITLFIIDDGIGCKSVEKNIGLSSMEERIGKLNGMIKYGSGGERGFSIFIIIPVEVV